MATLRSMTIENFKAIGEPVKIEFKPITLLFGPNSAGKSTIIQALCYAREIFVKGILDPHHIVVHGEQIDLGGFRAMVHNHDFSLPINITLELDLKKGDKLPDYIRNDEVSADVEEYAGELLGCLKGVRQVSVSVSVCWDNAISSPFVARYRVDLNGAFFCEIIEGIDCRLLLRDALRAGEIPINETNRKVLKKRFASHDAWLNFTHPVFDSGETGASTNLLNERAGQLLENHQEWHWTGNPNDERKEGCSIAGMETALPDWENPPDYWGDFKDSNEMGDPESYRLPQGFNELIKRAVAGPGKLVRDRLQDLRYLGPLRAVPPRILEQGRAVQETAGSSGGSTWEELFSIDDQTLGAINDWMKEQKRLNTGYEIDRKLYREFDSKRLAALKIGQDADRDSIINEISAMPERTRVSLRQVNSQLELSFPDVGTGISQVMPVVIAAIVARDQIVAIEQPELHIHPALQVKLGDLFISRIHNAKALFILETHSEHIMLRLLRRIRETTENALPKDAPPLKVDQVSVIFVEQAVGGAKIYPLRIDETGDFIDRWPRGFFSERVKELYGE